MLVDTDRRNEQTNSDFVSLLRSSTSPLTYVAPLLRGEAYVKQRRMKGSTSGYDTGGFSTSRTATGIIVCVRFVELAPPSMC